jgi:DNA replication protein DnaC
MGLNQVLNQATGSLRLPTPEELKRAENEIVQLYTQGRFYLSSNPEMQAMQIKCYAYKYVVAERVLHSPSKPMSEADRARQQLQLQIAKDHEITTSLMGSNSIYAGISWLDPTCKQTAVVGFLKEMAIKGKKACLLLGGTGSGKTFGSLCFVGRYAENKDQCLFYTAYKISELINRRAFTETDRLESVKYLIIDDLGVTSEGYKGQDFIAFFENLFTTRHQKGKYTLITSNGTPEQIRQVYGDRFVSRFKEIGEIFVTNDSDMRIKNATSDP